MQVKTFEFERSEPTFNEIQKLPKNYREDLKVVILEEYLLLITFLTRRLVLHHQLNKSFQLLDAAEKEKLKEENPFDFKYDPSAAEILDTLVPEALC